MTEERKRPESKGKKVYQSPSMILYGSVRYLTTGGSKGSTEQKGSSDKNSRV